MKNKSQKTKSDKSKEQKKDKVELNEQKEQVEEQEEIIIEHNVELEELRKKSKEYFELAQRTMADFDNYKKRTIKEKEMLYADAVVDIVSKFLPILDSLESALKHTEENSSVIEGIKKVVKQFKDTLKSIGVEEIKAVGEKFDPVYHYAVMHIHDEKYGENEVAEELQKGYIINDRVIRHSMVKVAN